MIYIKKHKLYFSSNIWIILGILLIITAFISLICIHISIINDRKELKHRIEILTIRHEEKIIRIKEYSNIQKKILNSDSLSLQEKVKVLYIMDME